MFIVFLSLFNIFLNLSKNLQLILEFSSYSIPEK